MGVYPGEGGERGPRPASAVPHRRRRAAQRRRRDGARLVYGRRRRRPAILGQLHERALAPANRTNGHGIYYISVLSYLLLGSGFLGHMSYRKKENSKIKLGARYLEECAVLEHPFTGRLPPTPVVSHYRLMPAASPYIFNALKYELGSRLENRIILTTV